MSALGHTPGDAVWIFSHYGASQGKLLRVTATGRHVVEQVFKHATLTRYFKPTGQECGNHGGTYQVVPHLLPKEQQDVRVEQMRRASSKKRRNEKFQAELQALGRLDLDEEAAALIEGLRALADRVVLGEFQ